MLRIRADFLTHVGEAQILARKKWTMGEKVEASRRGGVGRRSGEQVGGCRRGERRGAEEDPRYGLENRK